LIIVTKAGISWTVRHVDQILAPPIMKLASVLRSRRHHALLRLAAATTGEGAAPKPGVVRLSTSSGSSLDGKKSVLELLQRVADGKVSPHVAAELCGPAAEYEEVGDFAKIDTKREARTGFPEVVYAESKTPQQVAAIMKVMICGGEDNVMASRVTAQAADEIRALMPVQKIEAGWRSGEGIVTDVLPCWKNRSKS